MTARQVKIGIVGIGNMGSKHAQHCLDLPNTALAALCDSKPERLAAQLPADVPRYADYREMLAAVPMDAILIATPHYDHLPICLAAFERGLHVLVEKPIAVQVKDARLMIDAYAHARRRQPELVFAAMFQQRTWSHWRKIKAMIEAGQLGRLLRCTWLITDWFRTQHYYDSGDWRATWAGEGGGVLMNQCPHNLDLYQWLLGMPERAHGFVQFGKHHQIEVEDEVTAYFEHPGGLVGHFITATGESPGTNRLEIVGELGKLVYEAGAPALPDAADPAAAKSAAPAPAGPPLTFSRNQRSSRDEIRHSQQGFAKVPYTREVIDFQADETHGHETIIENFADAILDGAELIAPAVEGINQVMLGNAIMLSAHKRQTVSLPIDGGEYAALLAQYIANPPPPYTA